MKKILYIFGTRPEAIKLAPLILHTKSNSNFKSIVCITGQHLEMLDQALEMFNIQADYSLKVMSKDQTLFSLTTKIINKIEIILEKELPDIVIVHGDTTSTLCGSLAAYYKKIKIAHIEAGLRTGDKLSPWPEEGNRKIVGAIADLHFAPTQNAYNSLISEGIKDNNILITGNTVIDAVQLIASKIEASKELTSKMESKFSFLDMNKKLVLVTGHRRESFGEGFKNICKAIKKIAESNEDVEICYPVHLNPNVQKPVNNILSTQKNIFLIDPQDYMSFVFLMQHSYLILTDSGGIQEEAPSFGKPVLVMREKTERPEAIQAGTARLVGTDEDLIIESVNKILKNEKDYKKFKIAKNPYGDGNSSKKIVDFLENY